MEILVMIGVGIVVAIVVFVIKDGKSNEKKSAIEKQLSDANPEAKIFVSIYDSSYVSVDFSSRRLAVGLKAQRGKFVAIEAPYDATYDFDQIAEVSLIKDGDTVTSTNRGSQAIGAAVGAAAFGGLGAIVGGLSGSTSGKSRIRRITLRIKVDDPERPVHDITIFFWDASKKGVKADSGLVAPMLKQAEEFGTHISNAIRRAASSRAKAETKPNVKSIADQINSLWDLKVSGALTEQEFLDEKAIVLRRDDQTIGAE